MFEESREDLVLDVLWFHTVCGTTLLHHLQHDLLHLLIRGLELTDENQHHFSCVVVGIFSVHQRDEVTNGLQEGCQTFATVGPDTLPQGLEHTIKRLDAVRGGSLSQGRKCQGGDGSHLLLLINQS